VISLTKPSRNMARFIIRKNSCRPASLRITFRPGLANVRWAPPFFRATTITRLPTTP